MLGMMTMPSSIPVYKAVGQTLRMGMGVQSGGNKYGFYFIWHPTTDLSGFACPEVDPVFIPVESGAIDSNAQYTNP